MTDTTTLTLSEFLLARAAEDEAAARAAFCDQDGSYNQPRVDDGHWSTGSHEMDEQRVDGIGITIYDEGGHSTEQAVHIARHDPARVLAECEAKRRIVELHSPGVPCENARHPGGLHCPVCEYDDIPRGWFPCETLRALALPYADHDAYRDEWRP